MLTITDKIAAAELEDRRLRNERFEIEKQLAALDAQIKALHADLSRELKAAGTIKFAIGDLARVAPGYIANGGKMQTRVGVLFRIGAIVDVIDLPIKGTYAVAAWGMITHIPGEYLEAVGGNATTMQISPDKLDYRNESDDQSEGSR